MEIDSFPPVPNSKFAGSYRVHQTVVHGCKRNGSIVFNKAKMTHLKDLDETAYVPDHEDEVSSTNRAG